MYAFVIQDGNDSEPRVFVFDYKSDAKRNAKQWILKWLEKQGIGVLIKQARELTYDQLHEKYSNDLPPMYVVQTYDESCILI